MFKEDQLKKVEEEKKRWIEDLSKILCETPERLSRFTTVSDLEIKGLYTPEDTQEIDYSRDIGFPGIYPFTLHVSRKALDHANVLGFRRPRGDEQAFPLPIVSWGNRPFHRLSLSYAHGL
jgi:hypothetical protein